MNTNITTYNFSDHYLERLADDLTRAYGSRPEGFQGVTLIFGGKRPALFLRRELARRLKTSFVPPRILSMDEFISDIFHQSTRSRALNDLEAAFELFKIAQTQAPEILKGRETFARFWPWAREILGFIDQVDLEEIEDDALLGVQAQARIGYDVPEAINQLLTQIVRLRRAFHQFLQTQGFSRRGWIYRQAAMFVDRADVSGAGDIWFCNFFYWHKTEERIVKHLFDAGQARLVFQGDQRRWPVLKQQAEHLGVSVLEGQTVITPKFDLKLFRCSDAHAQASTVRGILESLTVPQRARTVIVVPETNHLVPLLSEISSVAGDFNVSMGYPLKRSSLHALLTLVASAQLSRKDRTYYARDYLKVLQHPFVKNLSLDADASVVRILSHKIEELLTGKIQSRLSGSLFIELADLENAQELYTSALEMLQRLSLDVSRDELKRILAEIHQTFFVAWESVRNFLSCSVALDGAMEMLIEKSFMRDYPLNMPIARRVLDLSRQWRQGAFGREEFSQDDIFQVLDDAIGREMVAFTGTPLKGLQVLGLFETRSLNFDHVIMIDVNEGVLPRLRVTDPLIPREVSQRLGISRLDIEEEIQRYQFLRLLSSARTVHLVYQENRETERSRFIEQLIWDKQKTSRRIDSVEIVQTGFVSRVSRQPSTVKKTDEMIDHLKRMTFSSSSVNMYLKNPMDFYRQYVLGIREDDDDLEEPGAKQIGTFVHALLQEAFEPLVGRKPAIDAAFRKRFEELFETRFHDTFARSMKSDAFLVKTVLRERLQRFLDHESQHETRRVKEVMALEKKFTQTIALSCGTVKFAYIVDRVDRMEDGTVMIIDYKTGGSSLMPSDIASWKDHTWSREYLAGSVRSFQIPLYYHYLRDIHPGDCVNAALYNLKTLSFDKFLTEKTAGDPAEIDRTFVKALDFIVSEITDPSVPFEDIPV